ncbi:DHHA1 domain-containing protein (plasmid) [Pseudomonas sp. FeN3W]|nr:DHHA1 domain-containing protein [Pseudomonas sp. FeN3W]
MTKTTILYHANCFDGTFSAAVAKEHFGDSATYVPVSYDKPLTDFSNQRLFFLDVVYKEKDMQLLLGKGNEIHVIDHHRDNVKPIAHLPLASLRYDANESGASLTFKHLNPGKELPLAIAHARDYDLWRFELTGTRHFVANQATPPLEVDSYRELLRLEGRDYEQFVEAGKGILAYKNKLVEEISASAINIKLKGIEGWMVNGPAELRSEIGNYLSIKHKAAFALIWSERSDGKIKVSLRSSEGDAPLQIAKALGGGGHDRAASAVMEKSKFNRLASSAKKSVQARSLSDSCCDHH